MKKLVVTEDVEYHSDMVYISKLHRPVCTCVNVVVVTSVVYWDSVLA
jgi:hypothetical protein